MSALSLKELMKGQSPYTAILEQTRGLVKKWEPTGLLEGLSSEAEICGMAVLLENQARQLIDEVSQTGGSENSEQWAGVALPLVRRIFGEIAAKEFVSIQPMNLPSGLIFYLDFKYGSGAQPGFDLGGSVYGGTGAGKTPGSTDEAVNGLYGQGRFGYSINDLAIIAELATGSAVSFREIEFNNALSVSLAASELHRLVVTESLFTRPDLEGFRAYDVSGSGIVSNLNTYAAYDRANNNFEFIVSASSTYTGSGADATVQYHVQPSDSTRGDFEDQSESGSIDSGAGHEVLDIPEIDIELKSEPIVAKTRKLKAIWTPELAQDLNAYHSIDAEAELTSLLSEYISMEIDLEILDMLVVNALTTDFWNALPGFEYNAVTNLFEDLGTHTGTKNEWYQTLGNKIQRVSNKIHQLTLRGGANFIVTSPDVATIIESIPGYAADTDGNQLSFAMGVQKVGMLNSRFQVYKNPYMTQNILLVGFRGGNFLETGAVYSPYIPLIMTPLVYDPNNFTPRRGVMTRYAKKIVRPEFYGKIIVANAERV